MSLSRRRCRINKITIIHVITMMTYSVRFFAGMTIQTVQRPNNPRHFFIPSAFRTFNNHRGTSFCRRRWLSSSTSEVEMEVANATVVPGKKLQDKSGEKTVVSPKDAEAAVNRLTMTWREHPDLNPTIHFRSWLVPVNGTSIQTILNSRTLQPYLATRLELLDHLHLRFKVVRDMPSLGFTESDQTNQDKEEKVVLLHPDTPSLDDLPTEVRQLLLGCRDGPLVPVQFSYNLFTASYILSKLLPLEAHPPPTAFETIGHVAHLNLRENHLPYKHLIGQVLLDTLPTIETVIHKVGEVSGPYRTYEFSIIAGRPDTEVYLTENGIQLHFDVAEVYWCSRLSEERKRLIRHEFRSGQIIADPFCGVGALCLLAANQLNCTIWANDWNPKAIDSLKEAAEKNGLLEKFQRVNCGDAYDFLMDIGLNSGENKRLPDHVVLNFPLEAPRFLGALRWWPVPRRRRAKLVHASREEADVASKTPAPRVHVYTFARADSSTNRSAEDVAVDMVASNLFPLGSSINRRDELNLEYGCDVIVHQVRDVAPGKVVMCVSFSATSKLLRHMQGDFSVRS